MNLGDITYAEFSLLRDLVRAKQLKEGLTVGEIEKIFQKIKGVDTWHEACYKAEVAIPATDRDCCAMLLHRIDEEEKKVQGILRQSRKT